MTYKHTDTHLTAIRCYYFSMERSRLKDEQGGYTHTHTQMDRLISGYTHTEKCLFVHCR